MIAAQTIFVSAVALLAVASFYGPAYTQNTFLDNLSNLGRDLMHDQFRKLSISLGQWKESRNAARTVAQAPRGHEFSIHGDVYFMSTGCQGGEAILPITETEFNEFINLMTKLKVSKAKVPYHISNGRVQLGLPVGHSSRPESVLIGNDAIRRKSAMDNKYKNFVVFTSGEVGIAKNERESELDELCVLRQSTTMLHNRLQRLDAQVATIEKEGVLVAKQAEILLKRLDNGDGRADDQLNDFDLATPILPKPSETLTVGDLMGYLDGNLNRARIYVDTLRQFSELIKTLQFSVPTANHTDWLDFWNQNETAGYSALGIILAWLLSTCICVCLVHKLRIANRNKNERLYRHALQMKQLSSKL